MTRMSHNVQGIEQKQKNPATKWFEWKSNEKKFSYYDKDLGENVLVDLPFKFMLIGQYSKLKGWNDAKGVMMYSNEVSNSLTEPFTLRTFEKKENKNGAIVVHKSEILLEGIYNELKTKFLGTGAKYWNSLYVVLEDGTIANISMKGSALWEWSNFSNNACYTQWTEVNKAKDEKKGSINYSVPIFSSGEVHSKDDAASADKSGDLMSAYMVGKDTVNNVEVVEAETLSDDLGF
jgi:hypothetical protein